MITWQAQPGASRSHTHKRILVHAHISLLTLAAASASADAHTDAAEKGEHHKTHGTCYQNRHIQRIYKEEGEERISSISSAFGEWIMIM